MSEKIVLFADNNVDFLDAWAANLKFEGYQVLKATSVEEAREIARTHWFHLAILDIHMIDDYDPGDKSGFELAAEPEFKNVPILILTVMNDYQTVREALGPGLQGRPLAVDFFNKLEDFETILGRIENAFNKQVGINWELDITWQGVDKFRLVNLLWPGLPASQRDSAVTELEDLLGKLFFTAQKVKMARLLWQRGRRVALSVITSKATGADQEVLVVCGQRELITKEIECYKEYAPKAPGDSSSVLTDQALTIHFGALVYILPNLHLESAQTLAGLYRGGSERVFTGTLTGLFEHNLLVWHQKEKTDGGSERPDDFYRTCWPSLNKQSFSRHWHALLHKLATSDLNLRPEPDGALVLQFGTDTYRYPNPTSLLFQPFETGRAVQMQISPGWLSGDNILADGEKRAWLTDFGESGPAPTAWNYLVLEANIRFYWLETGQFKQLHEAEQSLLDLAGFNQLKAQVLDSTISRALRAILEVRQLAVAAINRDPLIYQLGLLFWVAGELNDIRLGEPMSKRELTLLAHLVMGAAMLADQLIAANYTNTPFEQPGDDRLYLDINRHEVRLGNHLLKLTKTEFKLFVLLYDRAGQLFKRAELYKQLFDRPYKNEPDYNNHLNINIGRLRRKIEADPDDPRYLFTFQGEGYKLVLAPISSET